MLNKYIKIALPAVAAGMAFMPAAAHAEDFEGPYVGVEGGLGIVEVEGSTILGPFKESDNSAMIGGIVGMRTHLSGDSGLVIGAEGNLGIYTNGGDARYGISGIAGVQIGESSLLYTRLGYGWVDGIATPGGTGIDGIALGAGFETALADSTNVRLDYKYLGYEDFEVPDNTAHFSGHEITVGVVFGF